MGFVNVIFPRIIDKPPAIPYDSPKGGKRHGTSHKDVFQAISREDMERWAALFQPPDAGELRGEYGPG